MNLSTFFEHLDQVEELTFVLPNGTYVPLSVFAQLIPQPKGGDIQRKNGHTAKRTT